MRYLYTFLIMFGFWILLSGKFDLFHLILGVISSAIVSFISADVFMYSPESRNKLKTASRFLLYVPWLIYQIMLSTLHVAYLALHPRMKEQIDPTIVTFKTTLKTDIAKVALANSITLTPGTITVRIEDQVFHVHAISRKAAAGLPGEMEEKLAKVFEKD